MTPGARLQTAIEILDLLEDDRRPVERVLRAFFASRRYAGSKDRRAVSRRVYAVLRSRARLDWWCAGSGWTGTVGNRERVLASLVLADGTDVAMLADHFDGGTHRPASLSEAECALVAHLSGHMLDSDEQPDDVRAEVPAWLVPSLRRAFGSDLVRELQALNRIAPLDLRANLLKGGRDAALAALAHEGHAVARAPLSPVGLRVDGSPDLDRSKAFRSGLVEVQDEGSQLVALLADARPGQTVIDLCAGAGGKTLALAAAMGGEGRLVAFDSDAQRLGRMVPRLERAGIADRVERHAGDLAALADLDGGADRVLLDVPCSASGTWRRDPVAKWRLASADVATYVAVQRDILDAARRFVRPGGLLVYATCSVLPEENEDQASAFAARAQEFVPVAVEDLWGEAVGGDCPVAGETIRLSPARTGTDAYFVAAFRRRAA